MAPCIKVPIPAGQLRVAFKNNPPLISGIAGDSPLVGRVKIGYLFKQLILGNGAKMEGLDTNELVSALNEHSDDPNRMIKFEMCLPTESVVVLQAGAHGLHVEEKNGKPILTRIDYDSPLRKELRVGMVVDTIVFEDGYKISGFSAKEIEGLLDASDDNAKRTIIFRNPDSELSSRSSSLPLFQRIDLPAGTANEIGLRLTGEVAKITSITAGSPLDGSVRAGFVLETMKHPEGHEFRALSGKEMTRCINSTSAVEGRIAILKDPKQNKLPSMTTTKLMIASEGTLDDFGISVEGDIATIANVTNVSPYNGLINRGFRVKFFGWADGTEFEELTANELTEVIRDSSGVEGRYMLLENETAEEIAPTIVNIELQPGQLGAVFKGVPPVLTRLSPDSPLNGLVEIGMVVDVLKLSTGKVYSDMDTLEFSNALKMSSDDPLREIRFINLDEVELTKPSALPEKSEVEQPDETESVEKPLLASVVYQPDETESVEEPLFEPSDEVNVVLPIGKLSVTFKGSKRAIVSTVKESSPLFGVIPEGMGVDVVKIKGRKYMELNAADLAELLRETSDIPDRMIKLRDMENPEEFSQIPDELEVVLPAGKLGIIFAGTPPVAKSFKETSTIAGAMPPGMFVDKLKMSSGHCVSGFTTKELVKYLADYSVKDGRVLVLRSIKTQRASPKEEVFPDNLEIPLPCGKLGISFKGRAQARVSRLHEESQLLGIAIIGMNLDSIVVPGGSTFCGMTAAEAARVLVETKKVVGRKMLLKSPSNKNMAPRNFDGDSLSSSQGSTEISKRVG
eukprot:CAMPEP_0194147238 /NCGR_PEP_ID=MMETSP0152-20130528/22603_1 /TAXON_ID=1049557 /ORGANISM="Thalassiothrix antarctica, Strain L6-D1" /LENGTH=793 /DNA_ID=CAMNT_0038847955 /DNA_START=66 /DNA_END=2447 /DNA_ORIENTATION=-